MKVTSVELGVPFMNVFTMSFRDPRRENPYNVKAIVGLDSDNVIRRFDGNTFFGSSYYEMSMKPRDITIRIQLNPRWGEDETPSSLRDALYKLISSTRTGMLQMLFKNGAEEVAQISGYISKFEAPHFSKNSEVQISLKCEDPWLRAPTQVYLDGSGLDTGWAEIEDDISTAPHGMVMNIEVINPVDELRIEEQYSSPETQDTWVFAVVPDGGFLAGDNVYISSLHHGKTIYINEREGELVNIPLADRISRGSFWPILFPGLNAFTLADAADFSLGEISYYPTFWGV